MGRCAVACVQHDSQVVGDAHVCAFVSGFAFRHMELNGRYRYLVALRQVVLVCCVLIE